MMVTGVDIGETTGFAFIAEVKGEREVITNRFSIPKKDVNEYFIFKIAKGIENQLCGVTFKKGYTCSPELVVLEGYWGFGKGFYNVRQAELGGQVKRWLVDNKIPFYEAHIAHMKALLVGHGKASPSQVKDFGYNWVKDFAGIHVKNANKISEHEWDALLCAIYGFKYLGKEFEMDEMIYVEGGIVGGEL